jgi:hypothetical protein
MQTSRSLAQRRADALEILARHGTSWLATAGPTGDPHLILAAAAWTGERLLVATRDGTPTARNLDATRQARLGLGTPQDVVMVHARVESSEPATPRGSAIAATFRAAAGWDPADEGDDWRYFVLRPERIQAHRGYGEAGPRDVMRDGAWQA